MPQTAIAERLDISQQRVSQIIAQERRNLTNGDRQALIEREIAFLDHLRQMAMQVAEGKAVPVTAGKDGDILYDPEDNAVVRDHSGRLAAIARAQATSQDLRRLLGLDQPVKTEVTGGVRYEIVGVDPADIAGTPPPVGGPA